MKLVSEYQLEELKKYYQDILDKEILKYNFEDGNYSVFENLIIFTDEKVYSEIRKDHNLYLNNCQKLWNKYFWYLRHISELKKNKININNYEQSIFKLVEEIHQECINLENEIENFTHNTENFENFEYITFDYLHMAITETGVSLKSEELKEIIKILDVKNFSFEVVDNLILKNIDNENAELLYFRNAKDKNITIAIDTFSAGEDQIHPIDILIKCKREDKETIDKLLVQWWKRYWKNMGPFVGISFQDKFEENAFYKERKIIEK